MTEAQALTRQAGLRPSPTFEVEAGIGAIAGSRGEAEYSAAYFQTIERGGKREKRLTVAEKGVALADAEIPRLNPAEGLRLGDHEPQLDELQSFAREHRSDLLTLRLLEEQAAAETSLASADGRPDLTASVRYTRSRSSFDQFGLSESGALVPLRNADNIVKFGLSIPLKNRAQPAVDAAKSRQSQQTLRREQLERVIPLEVEASYRHWVGARRSLELLRTGVVEPSEKSVTVIREAYRLGQLRLFDVLNEQRRLGDLQLSYINAQTDVARALAELERAIGGNLP